MQNYRDLFVFMLSHSMFFCDAGFCVLGCCTRYFVALHCFVTTNMSIDKSSFDNNTNRKKEKGNCYNNYRGYEDLNHIKLLYLQVQKYDNPTNTTRVVHNLTHKDKQVMVELTPKSVFDCFAQINQVPRPSKREEKITAFLRKFGEDLGLETIVDHAGNVLIKKPATPGYENRKTVILQSHQDMVCEKNKDVEFDFDNDAIQTYIDG